MNKACQNSILLIELLMKLGKEIFMPNIKSSKKAVKVIAKKTENNHELKARVKNLIRNCDIAIKNGDKEKATSLFNDTKKNIDHAQTKGLIKENTAARQKSRLSKKIKEME